MRVTSLEQRRERQGKGEEGEVLLLLSRHHLNMGFRD